MKADEEMSLQPTSMDDGTRMAEVLAQIGRLNRALVKGGVGNTTVRAEAGRWRLLVGSRGVGKTTCICKWLAREVLKEGREVEVMRPEALGHDRDELTLLCEALRVPVRRIENSKRELPGVRVANGFIDLPGIDCTNEEAVVQLRERMALPRKNCDVYAVLNAAYDEEVLRRQVQTLTPLHLSGLIFTHLEEAATDGWRSLARKTGHKIAYVSTGPEVPGAWEPTLEEPVLPAPIGRAENREAAKMVGDGRGFAEMRRWS